MNQTKTPTGRRALFALLAAAVPARAQNAGDPIVGRHLAETWCSGCHLVAPTALRGASTRLVLSSMFHTSADRVTEPHRRLHAG
jgi:mono/diheme cytochrome c family protein